MQDKVARLPLLPSSALISRVSAVLPEDVPAFLVGGAVRDLLMNRPTHDLDFVLPGNALKIAKKVANRLGAAYFPLDEERDTARLVMQNSDGSRDILDFSAFRGNDLESDLRLRDFTINAMAVNVRNLGAVIDPLAGAADLLAKRIRSCSPQSFLDDPIRILRAVRLATALHFQITSETQEQMRQSVPALAQVSAERSRDEIFRILDGTQIATAVRVLDMFGVLPFVLPELQALKGVKQSPPHGDDVWVHSLEAVQKLEQLLDVLDLHYNPDLAANLWMGLVVLRLGRYRERIYQHLQTSLNLNRPLRPLLFLATLYHDTGKAGTQSIDEEGRIRFFRHEQAGERIIEQRALEMRLSNAETERLKLMIRHHLRPMLLAHVKELPSRRAIYHFFRDTGPAGVDICLLSLADVFATYQATLPVEQWIHHIDVIRALFEAYWETPEETVLPPVLVNGNELMSSLKMDPGPVIGKLLEAIREATATGQLHTREEALSFAKEMIKEWGDDGGR